VMNHINMVHIVLNRRDVIGMLGLLAFSHGFYGMCGRYHCMFPNGKKHFIISNKMRIGLCGLSGLGTWVLIQETLAIIR
jgi:hypothetical protein